MKMFEDFTVAVSRLRQVYQRRGRWRGSPCCRARRLSASTGPAQQTSQIDTHFFCNTGHHTSTILFIDAWSTRAVHVRRCTRFCRPGSSLQRACSQDTDWYRRYAWAHTIGQNYRGHPKLSTTKWSHLLLLQGRNFRIQPIPIYVVL